MEISQVSHSIGHTVPFGCSIQVILNLKSLKIHA